MPRTYEKRYDVLDANKDIHFHTHEQLLDECFGEHHNLFEVDYEINDSCRVYMPKILTDRNGNPKAVSSGWTNSIDSTNTVFKSVSPVGEPFYECKASDYVSLIFAMLKNDGDYQFLGAFVDDANECDGHIFTSKRIATKVRLIGNPVYDIELLDEDRTILSGEYIFNRPENAKLGTFNSWQIKNDNLVAKETDRYVFEYHESEIPMEVKWYFDADELEENGRINITLIYNKKVYEGHIKNEINGHAKILWGKELAREFDKNYGMQSTYPYLVFSRKGRNCYEISLIPGLKKIDDSEDSKENKIIELEKLRQVTEEDILQAIQEWNNDSSHPFKEKKYEFKESFLIFEGKGYPSNHIYAIAYNNHFGENINPTNLYDGVSMESYVGTQLRDRLHFDLTDKMIEEPLNDSYSEEEQQEQAYEMDIESLKVAAKQRANNNPIQREVVTKQSYRDPYIAEYSKRIANGICQLCGNEAPFNDKKGRPYLESHHIIWISRGGEDSLDNTVALCPNCHRKMHIVDSKEDIQILIMKKRG